MGLDYFFICFFCPASITVDETKQVVVRRKQFEMIVLFLELNGPHRSSITARVRNGSKCPQTCRSRTRKSKGGPNKVRDDPIIIIIHEDTI